MSLKRIIKSEEIESKPLEMDGLNRIKVYSPKIGDYMTIELGDSKGNIQKYNVGLGPGSWY